MRLCFIAQEQAGVTHERTGGIGNWMAAVTEGLAGRGHEVHIVVPVPAGKAPSDLPSPDGVTVHGLRSLPPGPLDVLSHWVWPRSVARAMRADDRFDVVVAQDYNGPAAVYAKGPRASPLVTHLHNTSEQIRAMNTDEHRGGRLAPVLRPMQASRERGQLADSDVIAGCSRAVLGDTIERYDLRGKYSGVLHSFIDVERVRRLGEAPFTGPLAAVEDPLVVFAGRIYSVKGVQELTLAMHRLWSEGSPARLVLAGTDGGWQGRSMVKRLRELAGPYADRLHHIGGLRHEQLFPLLRRAAVVALPSYWEALPLALVEAVALGCPVVTTTGHGATDVLTDGENGLLVPRHDSGALADAIAHLLADRSLAERLAAAAGARGEYFDLTPGLARFESFYADVTARSTSSAAV